MEDVEETLMAAHAMGLDMSSEAIVDLTNGVLASHNLPPCPPSDDWVCSARARLAGHTQVAPFRLVVPTQAIDCRGPRRITHFLVIHVSAKQEVHVISGVTIRVCCPFSLTSNQPCGVRDLPELSIMVRLRKT